MVHGYSATEPDYNAQTYYYSSVLGQLYDVTDGATHLDSQSNIDYGYVSVITQAEAEAARDYKLHSYHRVRAEYWEPQPEPSGNRWVDYYGFWFLSGDGYWYLHDFFGGGPIHYLDDNNLIELGETYDRKKVGVPHHVYLIDDAIGLGVCGQTERVLQFHIVDVNNRKTGRTLTKEYFPNGSFTDPCSGKTVTTTGTPFETDADARFQDVVRTGCPSIGGECGFVVYPAYFQWVPRNGGTPVNIAVFHRDVRYNKIGINGRYTEYPPDAQFFP